MKNKRKRLSDVDIQVLRSPSPGNLKSNILSTEVFLDFEKRKLKKDAPLKIPILPIKPFKTFSEKLSDLRSKERTKKIKTTVQETTLSKGFVKSNEKNKLVNQGIFQVIQNKKVLSSQESFYDPYSMLYLSKRNIPHDELSSYFKGKKIFSLSMLLKTVTAPAYDFPNDGYDWVVVGIIAYKSIPKYVQSRKKDIDIKSRYCVLTLTDLKWEISLFLFSDAFERYWKVQVGYIVAILNPGIMKPKKIDSGYFSLVLSHEYDSLLELGLSRDLGFCNVLKRDGKQCAAWIDIRHSEICAFHLDQGVRRTKNARMEIAVGTQLYSPKKNKHMSTKVGYSDGFKSAEGLLAEYTGWVHDPWNGNVFVMPGSSSNYKHDALDNKKVEKVRHRLQKQARESNILRRFSAQNISQNIVFGTLKSEAESICPTSSAPLESSIRLHSRPFSAQSVKRIGFDPYISYNQLSQTPCLSTPSSVCPLSLSTRYSSDSELEII
ncbi:hypothetical protein PMAC_001368 [Pneumocystis sp. 'macacae']|nr:hypothetical protein PMAC_001368 [Pneumocystis sp. 'macacae']